MLVAGRAGAMDVRAVDATYVDDVFRVRLEAVLAAPLADVEAVLADYTRYRRLDTRVLQSQSLGRQADGTQLVRTSIDACAGIFCRRVERVEQVQHSPGLLVATVVPERSDMRHGVTTTRLQSSGARTLVVYSAEFEPDFWVPAIIGHRYGTLALRESTLQMFANVEREARAR